MLSANHNIISHEKIIEVMECLGYEEVKKGVCNGLAQMWIQAIFCEETDKFIKRLYFICKESELLNKIAAAKAKKGIRLSDEDRACLEVLAFFDGVQLYQNFQLYTYLLKDKPHHLDAASISALTLPIKLEKHRITEIYSENRLFNIVSMQRYLNELANEFTFYANTREALKKSGQQLPELVIALHSGTHKTALRYNNRIACWELADANQYLPFDLPCKAAAPAILLSLTEGILSPVNISIFTTENNILKSLMQSVFEKFKRPLFINSASACVASAKNTDLLALTAMRGDEKKFIMIAKKIPNLQLREHMLVASKTAVYHAQTDIVKIILDQFPDCLMRSDETQEFLAMMITNWQNDLIAKIVPWGADVDETFKGKRPLHIAIAVGNLEAVKELIALDADISLTNQEDETPLFFAIKLHQIAIVDYLAGLKKTNLSATNKNSDTPLIAAVRQNSSAACEVLLKYNADPDEQNKNGQTAALVACILGHEECLTALIKHGADLNLVDEAGRSPIFIAVIKERWDLAAAILLNLKSLASFNPFSYQLTMNHLRDIIKYAANHLERLGNEEKKAFRSDIKHHRNALGLMLMKKPKADFCVFFKPKEKHRLAYKLAIRSACKLSTAVEADSRIGYIRL